MKPFLILFLYCFRSRPEGFDALAAELDAMYRCRKARLEAIDRFYSFDPHQETS